jgi:predicted TIM-barrel fold metal-dependent hydrolase
MSAVAVLDFHARLGPGPRAAAALLAAMDGAGIDRAVVCAGGLVGLDQLSRLIVDGGRADVTADNEGLHRACAGSGGRLLPFFFADPARDVDAYAAAATRFRGLEISPAVHGFRFDDPAVAALAELAATVHHPVYVVCLGRDGTRTADLLALARRFPTVTFVHGHCGFTGLDADGLTLVAAQPNIVVETSGCFTAVARLAVARLGPARVVFGTEFPLQDPQVELAKLAALELGPEHLAMVAGGNASRLLGLHLVAA